MPTTFSARHQVNDPPSDDKRWRLVNATMRRLGYSPSALIESLHAVQRSFGFLDEAALKYVAQSLRVPLSKVYGVATFYNHFRLKPEGLHTCVVCLGTACYIKGAAKLLEAAGNAQEFAPRRRQPTARFRSLRRAAWEHAESLRLRSSTDSCSAS